MDKTLLHKDIQDFIRANQDTDAYGLVLKFREYKGVPMQQIAEQIEARNRIRDKLPSWFNATDILYPNKSFLQQSSSEQTARFKSELISGESVIDISGGFGVDAYYFSGRVKKLVYCEKNIDLARIAKHNFEELNAKNIEVEPGDGIEFLRTSNMKFDWLYADPSRQHGTKGKVFFLEDCEPDVTKHLDLFFERTDKVLLKLSPMLDLTHAIESLGHVKAVYLVAVENEMKEMLLLLEKDYKHGTTVNCTDISTADGSIFSFSLGENAESTYAKPLQGNYLYEPNAAILKAGAFNLISSEFNLKKLHPNTHLYLSAEKIDFPGRRFIIKQVIPMSEKKQLKMTLSNSQANVSTRNFPVSVNDLRKKFKVSDGGDRYVFFTTLKDEIKAVLVCSKA